MELVNGYGKGIIWGVKKGYKDIRPQATQAQGTQGIKNIRTQEYRAAKGLEYFTCSKNSIEKSPKFIVERERAVLWLFQKCITDE